MKARDIAMYDRLARALTKYERDRGALPGIEDANARGALLCQMIDSIHRVRYPVLIRERKLSPQVASPDSIAFNPVKAAAFHHRNGEIDEACWLVFLFVHFGKHLRGGWRYLREVYAGPSVARGWTWAATSGDTQAFRAWLREQSEHIGRKSEPGGFGNHRKYESLDADKPNGTAEVVASYVRWVHPPRTHAQLIADATSAAEGDPRLAFEALYESMAAVHRFGRTARFDYLAMLGSLGIADIIPDKAYLRDATGPRKGAQLLFAGATQVSFTAAQLESLLQELDATFCVGMQVWEDALCNWQKHPTRYVAFRG